MGNGMRTETPQALLRRLFDAATEGFAAPGDTLLVTTGMPFGAPGSTNLLRIARVA